MCKICDFFVCFAATYSWFTYKLVFIVLCNFSCSCRIVLVTIFPCFTETKVFFFNFNALLSLCLYWKDKAYCCYQLCIFLVNADAHEPDRCWINYFSTSSISQPLSAMPIYSWWVYISQSRGYFYLSRFHYFLAWFNYNESHR